MFHRVVVLTGGRSARMGTPKALLRYKGRAQLARLLQDFAPLAPRFVISCREEQAPELEAAVAAEVSATLAGPERLAWAYDAPGSETPFEAVASILAPLLGERVLVLGVDQPLLASLAGELLLAASGRLVCFRGDDAELEPFPSAWRVDSPLVLALEDACARGHFGFRRFFAELGAESISAPEPRWLTNVNTPEQAQAAEAFLRSHSSRNASMRARLS